MSIPGLPSLASDVLDLFQPVALLVEDLFSIGSNAQSQWGIFKDGEPVVLADTVISVDFRQDFKISNYPVEQGAFSSYNKVQMPFEVKISFARGGSVADRAEFLNSIAAIIGDTNFYDVVMPEATYTSVNLTHQDFNRKASQNLGLLVIDVYAEEVRSASLSTSNSTVATSTGSTAPTADTTSSNSIVSNDFAAINEPQNPAAAPQANGGNVQPQTPTPAQQAAVDQVLQQSMLPF